MNTVYFQPKGIKPQYCEIGMISETDPEYIWYLDEPCKILISEVKIIDKKNVKFDKKSKLYRIMTNEKRIQAVLDFYLEKGINKESVNNVYFKILKCKKHSS